MRHTREGALAQTPDADGKPTPASTRLSGAFWLYWSCLSAGNLADGITVIAVTWLASSVTSNALLVATVGMVERLPWLLISLPAGVLVDRLPRLALMAGSDGARAIAMAALGTLLLTGLVSVGVLLVFACLFGVTEVLAGVAGDSAVPLLVEEEQLTRANGHVRASEIAAVDFVGRPLGGALLRLGTWTPFIGNAVLTGLGAVLMLLLRHRVGDTRPAASEPAEPTAKRRVLEGLRIILDVPQLKILVGCALVLNTLYGALIGVQVLFVRHSLGLSSLGYAILLSVSAIGGVLGSQYAARITKRAGVLTALRTSLLVMALCFIGVGLITWVPAVGALYAIASGAVALWSVSALSVRQSTVPNGMLGRVNATFRMVSFGVSAVGMLLGGTAVETLSHFMSISAACRVPYLAAGVLYIGTLVFLSLRWRDSVSEQQV